MSYVFGVKNEVFSRFFVLFKIHIYIAERFGNLIYFVYIRYNQAKTYIVR